MRTKLRTFVAWMMVGSAVALVAATPRMALAQTAQNLDTSIDVAGADQSASMTSTNNLAKTAVQFILNVVAKVAGVAIGIWGLLDLVKRDILWGVVKLCVCGMCFFLNRIILAMSTMGGA